MKVLIIGSKGFIGKNLTAYFRGLEYDTWGADVIVEYGISQKYLLIDSSNSDFSHIFQENKFELCINCSGAASVPESQSNPSRDYFLNTVNVFNLLEAIRRFNPECKFLNLSSAAVYGNPKSLPVKETATMAPLSPYGIHKMHSEQICKEFFDFFNINTCSVRIFSVYGPGLMKQLFWDIHKKIVLGHPLILYGTGNESRDFIYITDLVKAIDLVNKYSDFNGCVINIANGEEIFIKDVVAFYSKLCGNNVVITFSGEIRKGDPLNWKADIKKLKSLGYNPSIDMKTGLKKYYEWIEENNFF